MSKRYIAPQKLLELEPIILEELIKAKGKNPIKEVSNKLKIDQDLIRHIYITRKVGQLRPKQVEELEAEPLTTPLSTIDISGCLSYEEQPTNEVVDDNIETEAEPVRKRNTISDETKLAIIIDSEEGTLTKQQIADKYGISIASVYRIISYFSNEEKKGGTMKRRGPRKTQKSKRKSGGNSLNRHQIKKKVDDNYNAYTEEAEVVEEEQNELLEMPTEFVSLAHEDLCKGKFFPEFKPLNNDDEVVRVGLCKDRHDMRVTEYIYNTFNDTEMFDYKYIYDKALGFINCNCKKPDGTYKSIHLYCTGIQCALAGVIKACYDEKVNLALYHYNAKCNSYMRQEMWKFYDENYNHTQSEVFADLTNKGPVYMYGDFDPLTSELFVISINQNSDTNDGFYSAAYVLCSNMSDGFKLYIDYVEYINKLRDDEEHRRSVFLTKGKIYNRKFYWDMNISKSFNFK